MKICDTEHKTGKIVALSAKFGGSGSSTSIIIIISSSSSTIKIITTVNQQS